MAGLRCCAGFLQVETEEGSRGEAPRAGCRGRPLLAARHNVTSQGTPCDDVLPEQQRKRLSAAGCPSSLRGVRGLARVAVAFGLESAAVDVRDDLFPVAVDLAFQLFAFGFAVLFCHGGDVDFCPSSWTRVRPALLVTGPGHPWWRLPAHAPASADELCSPGGAGARIQAHDRSDARRHLPGATYGRSQAGDRFRRLGACGWLGQTLWDCKVLWCL